MGGAKTTMRWVCFLRWLGLWQEIESADLKYSRIRKFVRKGSHTNDRGTPEMLRKERISTHLLRDSSSLSNVFCLRSSSMSVTVTSFSRSLDSSVEMGGVTPR